MFCVYWDKRLSSHHTIIIPLPQTYMSYDQYARASQNIGSTPLVCWVACDCFFRIDFYGFITDIENTINLVTMNYR